MKKQLALALAAVLGISCSTAVFAGESEQFPETEIIVFAAKSILLCGAEADE